MDNPSDLPLRDVQNESGCISYSYNRHILDKLSWIQTQHSIQQDCQPPFKHYLDKNDNKTARYVMNEAQKDNPDMIDIQQKYFSQHQQHLISQKQENGMIQLGNLVQIFSFIDLDELMVTEQLDLVRCKNQYFNYPGKNESAYADVYNLLCIKDKSKMTLGGAWTTNRLEELDICLAPCQNQTGSNVTCAPQKDIESYFSTVDFQVRYVNQYFDFQDINDPVKSYIEDRYFVPVQTTQQKGMEMFVKKGFSQLSDNYFPFQLTENVPFVSVDNFIHYTSRVDYYGACYVKLVLRIDLEYELYTRKVYTFADLLTELGGIYSSLFALGSIFVGVLSENIFYTQIIKDVYQTKVPSEKKTKEGEGGQQTQANKNNTAKIQVEEQTNILQNDFEAGHKPFSKSSSQIKIDRQKSFLDRILFEIQNRVNFKFTFKDVLRATFGFIRSKDLSSKKHEELYRKQYLFRKGVKKINHEFDAISLLKLMKQVKLLTQVILGPTQKLLLGFAKKNVLDSESSGQETEDDDVRIIKRMRSKNPFVKLLTLGKIKGKITEYLKDVELGGFQDLDDRIIEGIMNKRHLEKKKVDHTKNNSDMINNAPIIMKKMKGTNDPSPNQSVHHSVNLKKPQSQKFLKKDSKSGFVSFAQDDTKMHINDYENYMQDDDGERFNDQSSSLYQPGQIYALQSSLNSKLQSYRSIEQINSQRIAAAKRSIYLGDETYNVSNFVPDHNSSVSKHQNTPALEYANDEEEE
ncbi:UNKNOWN [Stylonychia lemnae]|uniref:Uncharacterized protein n=1 Tax=Stylonychia lemnae TaxID=5949 RepID=A0A078B6B9_STYLE|nr:UNKNOWN [Stylonychia lemnae]|eukprot:CDW90070.1 UNKNOWN [Stylonychia lemnae]